MSAIALPEPGIWKPKLWLPGKGERVFITPRALRRPKEEAITQAISVAQSAASNTAPGTTAAMTISAPSSSNTLLVIAYQLFGSTDNSTAPTHTGSTFTKIGTTTWGAFGAGLWASTVTGTGTTVTANWPSGGGCAMVLEVAGIQAALDAKNSPAQSSTSPVSTGSMVTTNANDLLLVTSANNASSVIVTYTALGGSWTTGVNKLGTSTVPSQIVSYQVVSSTGSYSASQAFSESGSGGTAVAVAIWSVKAAAAAGGRSKPFSSQFSSIMSGRR